MIYIESKLVRFIQDNFDFEKNSLSPSYYYDQLPFCIIDAVYSIGSKYESTRRTVSAYANRCKLNLYRKYGTEIECAADSLTVSEFLKDIWNNDFERVARDVFCNRQRTSTRNGILKAEAVFRFACVLEEFSIQRFVDIHKIWHDDLFETRIKQIPGQRSGISLAYFYMLVGDETLIKPDRHILRFIESVTGEVVNQDKAQCILSEVADELKNNSPSMTVRSLDHMIWRYCSSKK